MFCQVIPLRVGQYGAKFFEPASRNDITRSALLRNAVIEIPPTECREADSFQNCTDKRFDIQVAVRDVKQDCAMRLQL